MISVVILVKNSELTLFSTLRALKDFPEVILVDTGSTDNTLEIAKGFPNVKIFHETFTGFGKMRNLASSFATYDWILAIDSDEKITPPLKDEILQLNLSSSSVVYAILRDNYLEGKRVRFASGWYPDWIYRLYNRKVTRFSEDLVHEKLELDNLKIQKLHYSLEHVPYHSIDDFLRKMQTYSSLFAKMNKGKPSSISIAFLHAFFAFFKSYLLKGGFLGGGLALMLAFYHSHVAWYKYLKLREINK